MEYRRFGRKAWGVSEIGYGMWGMAGWKGSQESESQSSLDLAVDLGCNFFDTAWGYGAGLSEQYLGSLVKRHPGDRIYCATKIPPKNFKWPSKSDYRLEDCFPPNHIRQYVEKSLTNMDLDRIDLIQFHVWEDSWAEEDGWKGEMAKLRADGKIDAIGISVNRWEPNNCLQTIRTGIIDAVQVIYNIFDQAPEDELFPLCQELDVAVIARVPFDEGTLTGTLNKESSWPKGDWRNTYFVPENLTSSVDHAEKLNKVIPEGLTMPEVALKFILANTDIATTIPGMRKASHVRSNLNSGGANLHPELLAELRDHRWDRLPTQWSQ